MNECLKYALDNVVVGVIIIDKNETILLWNKVVEKLSEIPRDNALGQSLGIICPTFLKSRYKDIISNVFINGQSRFCSSKLHKAFIFPVSAPESPHIRQNMLIEPICSDSSNCAMIQIIDITDQASTEHRLTNIINELEKGYEEAKKSEEYSKTLAERDALTGLLNRHGLSQRLREQIFKNQFIKDNAALLFLDLDGFKNINDTYGHMFGDALLVQVSGRLKNNVRKTDFVARLGGDEFVVVLTGIECPGGSIAVAEKIIDSFTKPFLIDNECIKITTSIGIAVYEEPIITPDDFISRADIAMYETKKAGKNGFRIYTN